MTLHLTDQEVETMKEALESRISTLKNMLIKYKFDKINSDLLRGWLDQSKALLEKLKNQNI